jgi:hypothetical protein
VVVLTADTVEDTAAVALEGRGSLEVNSNRAGGDGRFGVRNT